jgi:hypothetical protein
MHAEIPAIPRNIAKARVVANYMRSLPIHLEASHLGLNLVHPTT